MWLPMFWLPVSSTSSSRRPFKGNQPLEFVKPLMGTWKVVRETGDILSCFYPPFWPFSVWWCSPRDNKIIPHWFITHETDVCIINFKPDHVWMLVYPSPSIFSFSHSFSHPPLYYFLVVWHSRFVSAHWSACKHHSAAVVISGRSNWDTFLLHCMSWHTVFMMKYE